MEIGDVHGEGKQCTRRRCAGRGEAVYKEMCEEMYKEMCKEGVLKKKQARAVVQWIIGRWIRLD